MLIIRHDRSMIFVMSEERLAGKQLIFDVPVQIEKVNKSARFAGCQDCGLKLAPDVCFR